MDNTLSEDNAYFTSKDGSIYAGVHLLIDMWQAQDLNDLEKMRSALLRCVEVSGAVLRDIGLHQFGKDGGITGVLMLAQSHISVHSWPEKRYAAFDAFMCGNANPHKIVPILREVFRPGAVTVAEYKRGLSL